MLKTSFIKIIPVNIICVTSLQKSLNYLFVKGPQALYLPKIRSLKCISGINLSPANKNLLIMSFIL